MPSLCWQCFFLTLMPYFIYTMAAQSEAQKEPTPVEDKTNSEKKKCLPSEVHTESGDCVNREKFLDKAILHTWGDENLDKAKEKSKSPKVQPTCGPDKIMTAYGCASVTKPLEEAKRSPIVHSHLMGNQVIKGSMAHGYFGGFDTDDATEKTSSKHKKKNHVKYHKSGPPVLGHNRPRSYVHFPGRLLRSARHCRPYEVRAKNNRCIRKRGKMGNYKHRDHEYGLQRRHRHEATKDHSNEPSQSGAE